MKVFISSTVYDLLDARTELAEFLRSMGATTILSDDRLSEFKVEPEQNSIETCLVNVRDADCVLLILDRRYGPSLAKAGFEDLSATHLEYREAMKAGIPVHVFVRDRLEAEYGIWKKNRAATAVAFVWIAGEQDRRLFDLIEEHSKLDATSSQNNWKHTFSTSLDLKIAVHKVLNRPLLNRRLAEAIAANQFPLFEGVGDTKELSSPASVVVLGAVFRNVSSCPAFNVVLSGMDESREEAVLPGNCKITLKIPAPQRGGFEKTISVTYDSALGVSVEEQWKVSLRLVTTHVGPTHVSVLMRREKRVFLYGAAPEISIETK